MKKKIIGIFVCMLMIATVVLPATGTINEKVTQKNIFLENENKMEFVPGEFIVKLKKDTTLSISSFETLNEKHQVYAFEKMFKNAEGTILDNIYFVHVPIESDILSIVREYESCPDVVYVEPNGIANLCDIPNDVNFTNQWHLHNTGQVIIVYEGVNYSGTPDADIDASEAWDIETGSPDVMIAIVDSGIDYTHPDLAANIWNNADEIPSNGIDDDSNGYIDDVQGWDFVNNDNDPKDDHGHGTMCAGIAGAVANNGLYGVGVAYNCKIMSVKAGNETGSLQYVDVVAGIKYAVDNGADVISMSFGGTSSSIMQDAVNYAYGKGIFLCAGAGNSNTKTKFYPAAYDNVTAVAMTSYNDNRVNLTRTFGSNYGNWVDIAAPGHGIFSTMPTYHVFLNDEGMNLNFGYLTGTSHACPIVGGVAALLLSKDPSLTPDEVKGLLCANVDPYISEYYIGTGRLNAHKALLALELKEGTQIKGGLGVSMVMTNNGATDITNVSWQIHVEGGILGAINTTVNGTITIKAGESQTVSTGILLGLGGITISARVAGIEKMTNGTQLLIYSMVK